MRDLAYEQILREVHGCPRFVETITLTSANTSYRSAALPANARVMVYANGTFYMKIGDSTVTVSSASLASGGIATTIYDRYQFCLKASESHLAFISASAGIIVNIYVLDSSADGLNASKALEAQYGRPRLLENINMSVTATSYRSAAIPPGTRLMVNCSNSTYLKVGDSTVSLTGTTMSNGGIYLLANDRFIFCTSSTATNLAFISNSAVYARIFIME